jgi:hypothetical protein
LFDCSCDPLQRPDDFMAEMAKSDEHMQKVLYKNIHFFPLSLFIVMFQVRGKLLAESKGAAQQEERKKQRQQKIFGKEVPACTFIFVLLDVYPHQFEALSRKICLFGVQVQTKKLQEKEQAKRHAVESVTQWRKDRKSGRIQGNACTGQLAHRVCLI